MCVYIGWKTFRTWLKPGRNEAASPSTTRQHDPSAKFYRRAMQLFLPLGLPLGLHALPLGLHALRRLPGAPWPRRAWQKSPAHGAHAGGHTCDGKRGRANG